jgi:DNA polymerase
MPQPAVPHSHDHPEQVLQPHDDMLADTPEQATGASLRGGREEAMAALRDAALRCCRCDLCGSGHGMVFGDGAAASRLVIIGEAPGEEEDRRGKPFQGRAGQVLNALLEEAGIARERVWVTNTVKHRPTKQAGGRAANRAPLVPEIRACEIWRLGELEVIRPRVVCCLGAVAAKAILGRDVRMTQERGQWLPFSLPVPGMEQSEVLVTYHPAYILRQQGEAYDRIRAQAAADFEVVASRLKGAV